MTFNELRNNILAGKYDEHENQVYAAFKARRDLLSNEIRGELKPGMIATVSGSTPQYINGLRVKINEVFQKTARAEFIPEDAPRAGRFRHGEFRVPLTCLTPTDA